MSTRVGLGYLLGVIAASVSGRPESELNLPRTYGVWVESCLDTYFASFHERWPVVHGPVLRDDMDHVPLTVATLAMIGAWLQGGKALSDLILNAHGRLCSYALKQLVCHPSYRVHRCMLTY